MASHPRGAGRQPLRAQVQRPRHGHPGAGRDRLPAAGSPRDQAELGAHGFLYATPQASEYGQYFEVHVHDTGPFDSRPNDQLSFVANRADVSHPCENYIRARGMPIRGQISNLTLAYTYRMMRGAYLNGGLSYSINPDPIYTAQEGNSFLPCTLLVVHL